MKKLIFLSVFLVSCSVGGGTKVLTGATTTLEPGTLASYESAVIYSTSGLSNDLINLICPKDITTDHCKSNQDNLKTNYNFIISQVEDLTKSVAAYTITYSTLGLTNERRLVSGGVLIPNIDSSKIKGITLFYHPTVFSKFEVPSCFFNANQSPGYCLGAGSTVGEELAATLASQGYIVVMPDYIGQGIDNVIMHPYILYPQVNAMSGINMLIATRTLLQQFGYDNSALNLYITGFSEGGSYALWASKLLQTDAQNVLSNESYILKMTAAAAGAYDLINVQVPMEETNLSANAPNNFSILNKQTAAMAKPPLISYVLTSYGFYSQNQYYANLFRSEFLTCGRGGAFCKIYLGNNYVIPDLFILNNKSNFTRLNIERAIVTSTAFSGYDIFGIGDNSINHLVYSETLTDSGFVTLLQKAQIVNWVTNNPISIIYLNQDSIVSILNSIHAVNGIQVASLEKRNAIVKSNVIDNSLYYYHNQLTNNDEVIDHEQSMVYTLIVALTNFNQVK